MFRTCFLLFNRHIGLITTSIPFTKNVLLLPKCSHSNGHKWLQLCFLLFLFERLGPSRKVLTVYKCCYFIKSCHIEGFKYNLTEVHTPTWTLVVSINLIQVTAVLHLSARGPNNYPTLLTNYYLIPRQRNSC